MQFNVGDVLSKSFSITLKGFIPFFITGLIIYIPVFLLAIAAASAQSAELILVSGIVAMLFTFVLTGAITYGVVQSLKGKGISIGDSLSVGFARMFPVLGVSLVAALCVFGGLLLLIIPGIIVAVMLYVCVPAAVIEKPGVFGALGRSSELTKGHRWSIFAIVLVLWAISWVVQMVMPTGAETTTSVDFESGRTMITATPSIAMIILSTVVSMILQLWGSCAQAVCYYRLRQVKEGTDIDELAKVFE